MTRQFFETRYGESATITKQNDGTAKLIVRTPLGHEYFREICESAKLAKDRLIEVSGTSWYTTRGWVED